jgi:hypothetical protein
LFCAIVLFAAGAVADKEFGSDFGMSDFLPAIKTILSICLENCRLIFMTDRAGDEDVEWMIH